MARSLLRTAEAEHKTIMVPKSATLQKNLKGQMKKPRKQGVGKKGAKGSLAESCWVQSGCVMLSSVEQGQVEVLFEAIEKI
jgi:hypothetical protein